MSKNCQYRVRKHRALQTARKKEIKYVNEIIAKSSKEDSEEDSEDDNMSSAERNENGKFLLILSYIQHIYI